MKPPRGPPPRRWSWEPIQLEPHEVSFIKSFAAQHPQALEIICAKIADENALSFAPGGEDGRRATDFAEGKRWVARTLRQIVAMKMPGPGATVDTGPHAVPKGPPPED